MRNLILVGVLRKIQVCFVPRKSIFDLFGQKWPARMVTVKQLECWIRLMGMDGGRLPITRLRCKQLHYLY